MNATKKMMVDRLQAGEVIQGYREGGTSMTPLIKSRQPVNIHPINPAHPLQVGEIVFCKVKGRFYLHLIKALDGNSVQIGNNHGHINGWTPRENIFGRVSVVVPAQYRGAHPASRKT